ncbi:MAG: hypothetical protein HC849_13845 [Oscillatoriales cyanobacterium RU_3_3]|nr:hypothetical protein [Microcoleus sp. SU_5_6]NJL68218.1 hypothetical protein [Microcoleus sp. SM1_3_4]NJM61046.1 hypothetical protein [Oscillatoriales cyanobacterium RU_3_3]
MKSPLIFKVRIKNSDIPKGKSAGDRAIYYLKTSDSIVTYLSLPIYNLI